MAGAGGRYSQDTLRELIQREALDGDGTLTRLRAGVFRLRPSGEPLVRLADAGRSPVTRREVEQWLATAGARYSSQAIVQGLTGLVRDPASGVTAGVTGSTGLPGAPDRSA